MNVSRRQLLAVGLGAITARPSRLLGQTPPVLATNGAIPPNPFGAGRLPLVGATPSIVAPSIVDPPVEARLPVAVPPVVVAPAGEVGVVPPNPYDGGVRHYGDLLEEDIVRALAEAPIQSARNVGNTSVNLRCDLDGSIDGAFKPAETRHVDHWRAEIGAFRVAQLLGIDRVPPAVFRRVSRDELVGVYASRLLFREGWSRGAMIYWVPVLHRAGIFSGDALTQWTNHLVVDVDIPPDARRRAEEISTLISYDFIIGNWDRWHGTNTLVDAHGGLVYRDNNGGFLEPMPRWKMEIIFSFLQRVQRFSRRFVEQVRAMSLASLRQAIAADADGREQLLSEVQLRAMMRRRATFLEYVDALVGIHGAAGVLCFD